MRRGPDYILEFAVGYDPLERINGTVRDDATRLRGLLKIARRSFGLRCVSARPAAPVAVDGDPTMPPPAWHPARVGESLDVAASYSAAPVTGDWHNGRRRRVLGNTGV